MVRDSIQPRERARVGWLSKALSDDGGQAGEEQHCSATELRIGTGSWRCSAGLTRLLTGNHQGFNFKRNERECCIGKNVV